VPKKRKPTTQAVIELPRSPERETLEATVALDAIAAGHPDAYKLLEGLPATIGIGSDRYAARIVRATPSLRTLYVAYADEDLADQDRNLNARTARAFRLTKRGYTDGSFRLGIGYAENYSDPHF
jgi:hypothetical protein